MLLAGFYLEINSEERQLHWLTQELGEWIDKFPWIGVLVILMFLDILTGVIAAYIRKKIDSDVSFRGMAKKVQMLVMVGVGLIFEVVSPELPWGKLIAGLFIIHEMGSITENCGRAGLPLPPQLLDTLAKLKKEKNGTQSATVEININDKTTVAEPEDQHSRPN